MIQSHLEKIDAIAVRTKKKSRRRHLANLADRRDTRIPGRLSVISAEGIDHFAKAQAGHAGQVRGRMAGLAAAETISFE